MSSTAVEQKKKKIIIDIQALLKNMDASDEKPETIEIPPELKEAWEQHKRLEPREDELSFWNPSEETILTLRQMKLMAEVNDHRWSTIRVSRVSNIRDAKNPDKNPEIFPDKPIIMED